MFIVVACAVVAIAVVTSAYLYTYRSDALSATLKQDMLNRGMTAEEIEAVLEATLR
jgi:hypothetical protein